MISYLYFICILVNLSIKSGPHGRTDIFINFNTVCLNCDYLNKDIY